MLQHPDHPREPAARPAVLLAVPRRETLGICGLPAVDVSIRYKEGDTADSSIRQEKAGTAQTPVFDHGYNVQVKVTGNIDTDASGLGGYPPAIGFHPPKSSGQPTDQSPGLLGSTWDGSEVKETAHIHVVLRTTTKRANGRSVNV